MKKNNILKLKIFLLLLVMIFSFFILERFSTAVSISCSNCYVGNCQCVISNCNSGQIDIFETTCSGDPKYIKFFSGGSMTWNPTNVQTYYLTVYCNDGTTSACIPQSVSSGSTTSTTTSRSTTTTSYTSSTSTTTISSTTTSRSTTTTSYTSSTSTTSWTTTTSYTTSTSTTSSTITTTILDCSSSPNACKMGCGDTLTERSTSTKEYFKISLSSINDVSLSITPTQSADYDLLVKWDGSVPSETNYDCKSENGYGQVDVCPNTGFKTLNGGTYNVMTKYYKGSGTYDISLSCKQTITTTTVTTISSSTTITTTTSYTSSTSTTSTTTTSIPECSSFTDACKISCGKTLTGKQTNDKQYYKFSLQSPNDVSISINPSSNVDYDLYVKWGETQPTENSYDCKSENMAGETDMCPYTNFKTLGVGTYYAMVKHVNGPSGTYDISLSCKQTITTTTVIPSFDANSFTCSLISNGYRCQLNYTNNLDQDANVFFLFSDSKGKILSVPSQLMNAHKGSDVLSSVFLCTSNKGVYRIDWIAYLASDTMLKTPIKWSKTSETQVVNC